MEKSKRDNLLIIAMLVVATALITFCLPSKNFRNLDYRQGKPWSYPMLKAPFDIPIEYDTITKHRIIDSKTVAKAKRPARPAPKPAPGKQAEHKEAPQHEQ